MTVHRRCRGEERRESGEVGGYIGELGFCLGLFYGISMRGLSGACRGFFFRFVRRGWRTWRGIMQVSRKEEVAGWMLISGDAKNKTSCTSYINK